jgi:cytochrome c oxidase subunit 1
LPENDSLLSQGWLTQPTRYWSYPPEFQVLNVFSSAGASILAIGYLLPILYLVWSLKYGRIAGANPWRASGLEWSGQSPPLIDSSVEAVDQHEAEAER